MPHSTLGWDWKSRPSHEELARVLAPLGVRVYEDPRFVGSDSYGYIFSTEPLTEDQIREISEEDD